MQFYVILDAMIVVGILLYGSELWNKSSKYTEEMHTAWRITMRKIWKLHPRTYNNFISNIRSNFKHSLEKRHISCVLHILDNVFG